MGLEIRDEQQMRALTSVTPEQFEILLEAYTNIYKEKQWQASQAAVEAGTRQRSQGGGRKGTLLTMRDKLLFLLYYFKVYPTFDVLGCHFGMARSKAHENLHKLSPIFYQSLVHPEVMPPREFATPDELLEDLQGLETILIDMTERKQHAQYSRKKQHTVKNLGISARDKTILFWAERL